MTVRTIGVDRFNIDRLSAHYDLAICAVGYETRARFFVEKFNPQAEVKIAGAFAEQQVLAFDENLGFFKSRGYSVDVLRDSEYSEWLVNGLRNASASGKANVSVVADISSLSRVRIAHLISTLRDVPLQIDIRLDVVYCLASFVPPSSDVSPNSHVGPVSSAFAGWWVEPDRQLSTIVGLGYEQEKALGAVEYLEAEDIWAFEPVSVIAEYTPALRVANEGLLSGVAESQIFQYRVEDPLACVANLQSLVLGLSSRSNIVLLPFGPKIFALCCIVIAASTERVAVWRVSAQQAEVPIDRQANGEVYGLAISFDRRLSLP